MEELITNFGDMEELTPECEQQVQENVEAETVPQDSDELTSAVEEAQEEVKMEAPVIVPQVTQVPAEVVLPKAKSKLPLVICGVVLAAVVMAGAVLLLMPSKQDKAIEQAEKYLAAEQYRQAIDTLEAVESDSDVEVAMSKVYKAVADEVKELISDEEYDDALDMLEGWKDHPDYKNLCEKTISKAVTALTDEGDYEEALELLGEWKDFPDYQKLCAESVEEAVLKMLDDGEYVDAHNLLEKYSDVENYTALHNQVKVETIILTCGFSVRSVYKNPSSMQVNDVELYESPEGNYPYVILKTSGQNGFGGYASSLTTYSTDNLEYLGSTATMDPDDADDVYELLIIYAIEAYRACKAIDNVECDLARINSFLQSGKKPDMDAGLYTNEIENGIGA